LQAVSKPVWHIPLLCVQWKTPADGQRNCPKHVEFHFKNKFEKLVHLVGFIIRKERRISTYSQVYITTGNYIFLKIMQVCLLVYLVGTATVYHIHYICSELDLRNRKGRDPGLLRNNSPIIVKLISSWDLHCDTSYPFQGFSGHSCVPLDRHKHIVNTLQ